MPTLLFAVLALSGCLWLEGAQECRPACDKVFDQAQCAIDVGVIDHTAVSGCVARCADQPESTRTEWIYCVAGGDCADFTEGECLADWVIQGATGSEGPGPGEEIPLDTGEGW